MLERGLSLGYRRSAEGGSWLSRRYDAARRRHFEIRLGSADDHRDADGTEVLNFAQVQRKILAQAKQAAEQSSGQLYTVADAVSDYTDWLRLHRKSADETATKLRAYVLPQLGGKRVADLQVADFEMWSSFALKYRRRSAAKPKPKRKAKTAQKPEPEAKPVTPTPEEIADRARRRKATVNRVIAALKACLNHAHAGGKVASRDAWAGLRKFRSVDSARLRWLTIDEATRLQNAAAPDLRLLVRAALQTGCRAGELLAMCAGDFDPHSSTVLVADSKAGKPRRVPLTDHGVALFEELTAGKLGADRVFSRADGTAWYRVAMIRAMSAACTAGKIKPAATFHALRHTFASHLVSQGMPMLFVAAALGHRDTRMCERHYAHFQPSKMAELLREHLPSFGAPLQSNVKSLRPTAG